MDKPVLLYDAKCQLCRNLAVKIQFHAKKPLDIVALSDPEAARLLEGFYPNGWKHDFYLIENGSVRKGLLALPKLVRAVGARRFSAVIGEFAAYRVAKPKCSQPHDHKHEHKAAANAPSRRQVIAMAAAAPLLVPLSKLPRLDHPFAGRSNPDEVAGIGVNLAIVRREAPGLYRAEARPVPQALGAARPPRNQNVKTKVDHREEVVLAKSAAADDVNGGLRVRSESASSLPYVLQRTTLRGERTRDGVTEPRSMDFFGLGVDHGRFNLSVNVGSGTSGVSLSGMVRHDLALPLLDYIVFDTDGSVDAAAQLAGYVEGVRALRQLHAGAKRDRVATLYGDIETAFVHAAEIYASNVHESWVPSRSEIVITSTSELMQFVDLARVPHEEGRLRIRTASTEVDVAPGGCTCNCSCGVCCGIGCGVTVGVCSSPWCGLCCGVSCGCGCSCCL